LEVILKEIIKNILEDKQSEFEFPPGERFNDWGSTFFTIGRYLQRKVGGFTPHIIKWVDAFIHVNRQTSSDILHEVGVSFGGETVPNFGFLVVCLTLFIKVCF
jgi:hypothetical protein